MNTIKLAKSVEKTETIQQIQDLYGIEFPVDIISFLKKNSRGIPNKKDFLINNKKYFLTAFVSVSAVDRVNILKLTNQLNSELKEKLYVPFAMDGVGNFYCIEYIFKKLNHIVFWDMEIDMISKVCDSFGDLLEVMNLKVKN